MSKVTYFVAMPFLPSDRGRLKEGEAQPANSAGHAKRMAEAMAERAGPNGGAVAFSRTGDPESGDWEDAVVLAYFGEVPMHIVDAAPGGVRRWPEAMPA
jgi:hypothetical protein